MNDSQLRSFLVIADCGSFSQAEHILYLSKQALKKQMDSLEEELGYPLLLRSSQGIRLTEAGEAFLAAAPGILKRMDDSVDFCRQVHLQHRPVRVSVSNHPSLLLAEPTWKFCQDNPDIQIRFHFITNADMSPPHQILSGETDVFEVTMDLQTAQPVTFTHLTKLSYRFLLSPDHPLALRGEPLSPVDLIGQQVVMNRFSWTQEILDALTPHCQLDLQEESTTPELELAYNTCFAGNIFLTTSYYAKQLPPLVTLPLALPLTQEFGFLYSDTAPSQVLRYVQGMKRLFEGTPVV